MNNVPQHKYKVLKLNGDVIHLSRPRRFDGWLGSGLVDKNGKEVFEGDRVRIMDCHTTTVEFVDGTFKAGNMPLEDITALNIEVVGHVTE